MIRDEGAGRESAPPLVVLDHITKRFPGVIANDDVSLELRAGEVHALIGENGAGKSTLMRVLYGMYPADAGKIEVRGQEVKIASPRDAIALGIGMVHQHFVLVDPFTVTENIILGDEGGGSSTWTPRISGSPTSRRRYGFQVRPSAVVEDLSVGEEQRVEILKALYRGVDVLILDEPTAVLTPAETEELFENLRRLREAGKTIVFISHKLDEVLDIADRITVLRRGHVVGEALPEGTTKAKLAEMMVGRPVLFRLEKPSVEIGEPVLQLVGLLGPGNLNGISLEVRAGEIVGIAGVEGNGQRELAETIMGLRPASAGSVRLAGREITGMPVREIRNAGMGFIPEDRHAQGLVLDMTHLGERRPGPARRPAVLEPVRRARPREDQGAGGAPREALRRAGAGDRRPRRHALRREPAEADPRAGARPRSRSCWSPRSPPAVSTSERSSSSGGRSWSRRQRGAVSC